MGMADQLILFPSMPISCGYLPFVLEEVHAMLVEQVGVDNVVLEPKSCAADLAPVQIYGIL